LTPGELDAFVGSLVGREEVDAVRAQHELFARSQEVLRGIYANDAEWMPAREEPDAAIHVGADAIQAAFTQWAETFEDIEFEGREVIDADDKVFAWIRISGRGVVSGIQVEMEQAQVWTFRDGKAVRVEEYFDRDEALRAAGLAAS
jgi:ketosteroid isomerase-like protein